MSSPKYRPTVYNVAGPVLATYGFKPRPDLHSSGVAVFTRELRGYQNTVEFLVSNHEPVATGRRAFRFDLEAPKYGKTPSYRFTDRTWWYYDTQEELETGLVEATHLLVDKGLAWLDTYTPGNVPDWDGLVQEIIGPVLKPHGFVYQGEAHPLGGLIHDLAWFRRQSEPYGYAAVDLRVPGEASPVFTRKVTQNTPRDYLTGPTCRYSRDSEMPDALRQAAAFFNSEVARWIAQPKR